MAVFKMQVFYCDWEHKVSIRRFIRDENGQKNQNGFCIQTMENYWRILSMMRFFFVLDRSAEELELSETEAVTVLGGFYYIPDISGSVHREDRMDIYDE